MRKIASIFSPRLHGSVNHNVKATYVLHLGWFIGNPATLHELTPEDSAKRYVDMMGGMDNLLKKSKEYYDKGEYRWVAQVTNHAVFADRATAPRGTCRPMRWNSWATRPRAGRGATSISPAQGAAEGVKKLPTRDTAIPDTVRAMSMDCSSTTWQCA